MNSAATPDCPAILFVGVVLATLAIITEFRKLSHDEKAALLDLLWDEYASDEAVGALSDEDIQGLDRRMGAYRADPSSAVDAEEVFREMRALIDASE